MSTKIDTNPGSIEVPFVDFSDSNMSLRSVCQKKGDVLSADVEGMAGNNGGSHLDGAFFSVLRCLSYLERAKRS